MQPLHDLTVSGKGTGEHGKEKDSEVGESNGRRYRVAKPRKISA